MERKNLFWLSILSSSVLFIACPETDSDGDGYTVEEGDCNDSDASINPESAEICDGIDQNCDSQIDEGVNTTWYLDSDSDGYGDANEFTLSCVLPEGYSNYSTDCDDDNDKIYPNAFEVEDGLDNDCNGITDEISEYITIAGGGYHFLSLKEDGTVWAWGSNKYGQLGDGSDDERSVPVKVLNLDNIVSIDGGFYHSLALNSDGLVFAWGNNGYGQHGNGTINEDEQDYPSGDYHTEDPEDPEDPDIPTPSPALSGEGTAPITPSKVENISEIVAISAGSDHNLALEDDGTIWSWGKNFYGQLGDGTFENKTTPTQVKNATNIISVAGGYNHSLALKSDGTVLSWGDNWSGQLGNGTTVYHNTPVQVINLTNVTAIASGGYHSLAIKSDRSVWGWGSNEYGQVGDGNHPEYQTTPAKVLNLTDVIAIEGGGYHSLAIKMDGSVFAWGYNGYGQLGDGTYLDITVPTQVLDIDTASSLGGGFYSSLALKNDDTLLAWGDNRATQLGNGTTTDKNIPTQVTKCETTFYLDSDGDGFGVDNSTIACIVPYGYADNSLDCDDDNEKIAPNSFEIKDGIDNDCDELVDANDGMVMLLAGGGYHSLALQSDGTVWAWGLNWNGQLGDGATSNKSTPVQVLNLTNITSVAGGWYHSLAAKSDGTVWAWGYNYHGQLGNGATSNKSTPVQVLNLTNITSVAGGFYHSLALKSDGTIWAWGYNEDGELGDGTYTTTSPYGKSTPVAVKNLTKITSVAGGGYHSLALKSDGTIWAWGYNGYGELGDGTYSDSSTPVAVKNLTNITSIAGGGYHSLALKSDGTVWAWGGNASGQLGDGSTTLSPTPVAVKNLTNITSVSGGGWHSLAVKSDGTAWAWGSNYNAQLGNGTTTTTTPYGKSTPAQILNLTNITSVAGGGLHSLALQNDSSIWSWGNNYYGQVGNDNFYSQSLATEVSKHQ